MSNTYDCCGRRVDAITLKKDTTVASEHSAPILLSEDPPQERQLIREDVEARILGTMKAHFDRVESALDKVLGYLEPEREEEIVPATTTQELEELCSLPDLKSKLMKIFGTNPTDTARLLFKKAVSPELLLEYPW